MPSRASTASRRLLCVLFLRRPALYFSAWGRRARPDVIHLTAQQCAGSPTIPSMLLICVRCGYAPSMSSRASFRSSIRRSRITRILMLVLGVLAVPSLGPAAMQRPHCAQHDTAGEHTAHAGGPQQLSEPGASLSWRSSSQHECAHCPPTECAQVAACTTSTTATIIEVSGAVISLAIDRVTLPRLLVQPASTNHEPPTPPPQLIS